MWAHKIKNAGIEWLPAQRGQGMGQFWGAVTQEEVTALYDLSNPTASLVVASLQAFPQNAKEDTVTRWLKRYLIKSGDKMSFKICHSIRLSARQAERALLLLQCLRTTSLTQSCKKISNYI